MRFFYSSILLGLLFLSHTYIFAQTTLSGIINKYTKVTAIDAMQNMLTVNDLAGFKICDTILIIQMKGASINRSNNSSYGNILAYNNAGNYEKAIIYRIVGNNIFLRHQLLNTYNPNFAVQIVSIPQYAAVNITNTLTGKAWDGNTGGIIAFESSDIVKITGLVDASGIGFRGGNVNTNTPCNSTATDFAYLPSQNIAGMKGEGIVVLDSVAGKGAAANGGGGGSCRNGGGGGGANAGAGGIGGKSPQSTGGVNTVSGIGGKSFGYTVNNFKQVFLGGAGGAGNQDDNLASNGGNGGGIVYIAGKQIVGNGLINANGQAPSNAGIDGAGGGGAGGTVLLNSSIKSFAVQISVKGADGGNNISTNAAGVVVADCFATGGGGGGGLVALNGGLDAASIRNEGGNAGKILAITSPCVGTSHGANAGENGQVLTSINFMPISTTSVVPTLLATVTTSAITCTSATQTLTANVVAGASYQWQREGVDMAGETSNILTATISGIYRVKISVGCNTVFSSNIVVTINGKPVAKIYGGDIGLCPTLNASTILEAAQGTGYLYQWRKDGQIIAGATAYNLTVTTIGVYQVDVSVCGVTSSSNQITVIYTTVPNLLVQGENVLCPSKTITLYAFPRGVNYQWYRNGTIIAGAIGDTYEVTQTGRYWVVTFDFCVRKNSDEFIVTAPAATITQAVITGQNNICAGKNTILSTNTGTNFQYRWLRDNQTIANATQSTYTASQAGDYSVVITDACNQSISSQIFKMTVINPPDNIFIRGNNLLCNGESRLITTSPKNPLYKYQWTRNMQTIAGATDTTFLAKELGTYAIEVKDSCGNVYISPNFTINPSAITTILIQATNNRTLICPSEKVTFTATANLPTTDFQWQRNGVDIVGAVGATFVATSAGSYTARSGNICSNVVSRALVLQVATPPLATITGNLLFCSGGRTTLTANAGTNLTYQWFKDGEPYLNASSQTVPIFVAGKFRVLVSNEQGCSTLSDEVVVNTSRIDETQVKITPSRLLCAGEKVQLSATGGTKYEWSPTTNLSNPFIANPIASPTANINYKVKISNDLGCFVERFVSFEVIPEFILDFEVLTSPNCGQKTLLQINNKSTGLNAFNDITWDMGNGDILKGLSPTAYIYAKGGNYTITMTVNNRNCTKTLAKDIVVESLFTPNVITPNNDGKNDSFMIDNPNEKWAIEITDRMGRKVFSSENYNNDWSGEKKTGIYFYHLTSPSGNTCKGWIQVLGE